MRVLFAISLLAVAWLAGCTGLRGGIERDARRDSNETGALLKRASDGDNSVRSLAPVVVDNGLWVSAGTVKLRNSEQLPPLFDEPASFDRSVASLSEFAEQITRLTQVPKVGGQAVLGRQSCHTTPWLTERHGYDPT